MTGIGVGLRGDTADGSDPKKGLEAGEGEQSLLAHSGPWCFPVPGRIEQSNAE